MGTRYIVEGLPSVLVSEAAAGQRWHPLVALDDEAQAMAVWRLLTRRVEALPDHERWTFRYFAEPESAGVTGGAAGVRASAEQLAAFERAWATAYGGKKAPIEAIPPRLYFARLAHLEAGSPKPMDG